MRTTDILARLVGDSFALLLPEADRHGAYQVAERIRRQVSENRRAQSPHPYTVHRAQALDQPLRKGASPSVPFLLQ